MWRIDLEVYGLSVDSLVRARYSVGLVLNLALDLLKIVESAAWHMIELSPLLLAFHRSGRVRNVNLMVAGLVVSVGGEVYELKNERSSGDDAASTGEKVATDDVLED